MDMQGAATVHMDASPDHIWALLSDPTRLRLVADQPAAGEAEGAWLLHPLHAERARYQWYQPTNRSCVVHPKHQPACALRSLPTQEFVEADWTRFQAIKKALPAITSSTNPGQGLDWLQQMVDACAGQCDISVSQARRKLQGAGWLFDEVLTLAQHHGLCLDDLAQDPTGGTSPAAPLEKGHVLLEGADTACQVQIGHLLAPRDQAHTAVQAVRDGDRWLIGAPTALRRLHPQGPRYAVPDRVRLPGRAAALDADHHVVAALRLQKTQGLVYPRLVGRAGEVLRVVPAVHRDAAVPRQQADPGHARLAPARAAVQRLRHLSYLATS